MVTERQVRQASASETVVDVLPSLIDSLDVAGSGELLRFAVAGRMQHRTRSDAVLRAVEAARARKAESHQPFWDALFDQMPSLGPADVSEILRLARFHQSMDTVATRIPFALRGSGLKGVLARHDVIPENEILALSSRLVLASGAEAHLPMLDYRVPITRENAGLILDQLKAMQASGWLFASGRSYHFLGDSLLDGAAGLAHFLGQALLFSPIVDGRWLAHQLIEGACALRVSSGDKSQVVPMLVARVDT